MKMAEKKITVMGKNAYHTIIHAKAFNQSKHELEITFHSTANILIRYYPNKSIEVKNQ